MAFDQQTYVEAYQRENVKRFTVKVNRLTEPEVIEHLKAQKNVQRYIINLIKADMEKTTE